MAQEILRPDSTQRSLVACTALAAFVFQFEANLVNVSLPTIARELKLTPGDVSLIPMVYLTATAAALIPSGRLGLRFGLKRVFILAVLLMILGTTLCGMPCPFPVLLAGRLAQGLGAGGMAALAYAIIPEHLPASLTGYGYGMLSMAAGLGMLVGNPGGGLLAQFLPWRFVFLASVPLMFLLVILSIRNLPAARTNTREGSDVAFADSVLLGVGASSILLILSSGKRLGFQSSPVILAYFVFGVCLALLAARRRRDRTGLLPPEIFGSRQFLISIFSVVLVCAALGGITFLMPFYCEKTCGLTPAFTSILMLVYSAAYTVMGPFAGGRADKGQARNVLLTASCTGIAACGLFSAVSGFAIWQCALVFLIVIGGACGMFFSPTAKIAIESIPGSFKEQAAVFMPMAMNMGQALGVLIFETVFSFNQGPGGPEFSHIIQYGRITLELMHNGFLFSFLTGSLVWFMVLICILKSTSKEAIDKWNKLGTEGEII